MRNSWFDLEGWLLGNRRVVGRVEILGFVMSQ